MRLVLVIIKHSKFFTGERTVWVGRLFTFFVPWYVNKDNCSVGNDRRLAVQKRSDVNCVSRTICHWRLDWKRLTRVQASTLLRGEYLFCCFFGR